MFRSLNLDSMFVPTNLCEIEFDFIKFSGGELHIKLNNKIDYSNIEKVVITARIKSSDDLMKLLIAKDALVIEGVKNFDLIMPYIPYARQDRKCYEGESFSLKVFTNIINTAKFDKVYVLDSHSDVAPALIDNCVNLSPKQYINMAVKDIMDKENRKPILVSPDSGANKKINKLFSELNGSFDDVIKCDKKRDTKTGELSGFEVFSSNLEGKPCIIADDICDKGGTFKGLSDELRKKNSGNVYLFITHAILPDGSGDILKFFKSIYSTNSFNDIDGLIQYKINI